MSKVKPAALDCKKCGACCAWSSGFVDVTFDDKTPTKYIDLKIDSMKVRNGTNRCVALRGHIGKSVRCSIYKLRPTSCRTYEPGNYHCLQCRESFNIDKGQDQNENDESMGEIVGSPKKVVEERAYQAPGRQFHHTGENTNQ